VPGLTLEVVRLNDAHGRPRTPVLFFELPASEGRDGTPAPASGQTVLMYGHLDKQPEFTGWRSDLGPLDAQDRRRQVVWARRRR
jgi:hypothetical protein